MSRRMNLDMIHRVLRLYTVYDNVYIVSSYSMFFNAVEYLADKSNCFISDRLNRPRLIKDNAIKRSRLRAIVLDSVYITISRFPP